MTRVKICGLSEVAHALAAAEAGADFIGVILAPSKRRVTPEKAQEIVMAVKGLDNPPQAVGVFVKASAEEVNRIAEYCSLDWVQLSGDEPWTYTKQLSRPVIKVVRVSRGAPAGDVLDNISLGHKILQKDFIVLLDTHVEGSYGGTGQTFDWSLAAQVAGKAPIIVAGGLSPDNVAEVVRRVRPWGVDVSSGVESKGIKDVVKIKEFVLAARRADEEIHENR